MNWQKELEARLADDPRLERKPSRREASVAFYAGGKEIVNFPAPGTAKLLLTAAGIFAMGAATCEDCVQAVGKDSVLVRVESEADLNFVQSLLEKRLTEKKGERRPSGKQTRKAAPTTKKAKATKAFSDAQALRDLRNLKPS